MILYSSAVVGGREGKGGGGGWDGDNGSIRAAHSNGQKGLHCQGRRIKLT